MSLSCPYYSCRIIIFLGDIWVLVGGLWRRLCEACICFLFFIVFLGDIWASTDWWCMSEILMLDLWRGGICCPPCPPISSCLPQNIILPSLPPPTLKVDRLPYVWQVCEWCFYGSGSLFQRWLLAVNTICFICRKNVVVVFARCIVTGMAAQGLLLRYHVVVLVQLNVWCWMPSFWGVVGMSNVFFFLSGVWWPCGNKHRERSV